VGQQRDRLGGEETANFAGNLGEWLMVDGALTDALLD
jgi:hypothetical protein